MIKGIKNIIFDLGGVILNIDYDKTRDAFIALGIIDFEKHYAQAQQDEVFSQFETGAIDATAFMNYLKKWSAITDEEPIITAWNAMLQDFPLRRLQILQQLQLHYNIVLLSNTNPIHEQAFNSKLKEVCGFNTLAVFFDKIFYSHQIGLRKPDAAMFEYVMTQTGFLPKETLFIDDSLQHVESAAQLGFQTIWLEKGMTIEKDIFKPKY